MHPILLALLAAAVSQPRPPIRLVLEYTIDDSDGVSLGQIQRIELGPDSGVVLVDGGNGVIYRFTPSGALRDSLGRKGQGPGEFQVAAGLAVGPGGQVALADLRTRRLTIWEADGKLRGSTQLGSMPVDVLWRGADPIVGLMSFGDSVMIRFGTVEPRQGSIGTEMAGFPDPRIADYPRAVSCGVCRRELSPAGNLVVAAPDTFYRVSELDAGGRVLRGWSRTGVGAGLRTPEELAALRARLQQGPGGSGGPRPPGLEGRFRPPDSDAFRFRPRFQGLGFDAAGRLLALVTNAGSTRPVLDVFAPAGGFLGTVVLEQTLQAMVVRGRRVAGLGETPDGTPAVFVYRIEELPGR